MKSAGRLRKNSVRVTGINFDISKEFQSMELSTRMKHSSNDGGSSGDFNDTIRCSPPKEKARIESDEESEILEA